MARIGFKSLHVWARARDLAVEVYRKTNAGDLRKDWILRDQMRRAVLSVASNIAEGAERGSNRDAVRFLFMARGSLAELSTQSEIAAAAGLLDRVAANEWIRESGS